MVLETGVFEAGHKVIRDRQALRQRVQAKRQEIEGVLRTLSAASAAPTPQLESSALSPDTDVSATIAEANALIAAIAAQGTARQALEAELAQAQAHRAKMTKYTVIAGVIVFLLLILFYLAN